MSKRNIKAPEKLPSKKVNSIAIRNKIQLFKLFPDFNTQNIVSKNI